MCPIKIANGSSFNIVEDKVEEICLFSCYCHMGSFAEVSLLSKSTIDYFHVKSLKICY
jgi:hypothetical protein